MLADCETGFSSWDWRPSWPINGERFQWRTPLGFVVFLNLLRNSCVSRFMSALRNVFNRKWNYHWLTFINKLFTIVDQPSWQQHGHLNNNDFNINLKYLKQELYPKPPHLTFTSISKRSFNLCPSYFPKHKFQIVGLEIIDHDYRIILFFYIGWRGWFSDR